MARPYRRALAFLGFWCGRLLISAAESTPRQPASLQYGIASLQGPIAPNRPHRHDEGVNHFSAGHFLTHHSQPDCGGEGTPRLSLCFGRLSGSRRWSSGPQSISANSDAAVMATAVQ